MGGLLSTTGGGCGRGVSAVERCGPRKMFKARDVIGKRGGSHSPGWQLHNNCVSNTASHRMSECVWSEHQQVTQILDKCCGSKLPVALVENTKILGYESALA